VVQHLSKGPHAIRHGLMGPVDVAEKLGCENGAVVIHDHADSGLSPATLQVHVVPLGFLPCSDQRAGGLMRPAAGADVFTDIVHTHSTLGHQRPLLEPEMGEVAGISFAEFPAVPAHELRVLLSEAIKALVTLQRRLAK